MNDPRKLMIALAISIGLNLFLGGFMVARVAMRHHHMSELQRRGFGPHPFAGPRGVLEDVTDDKSRKHLQKLFDGQRGMFDRDRDRMRNARQAVARALEQEPFDRSSADAAFTELRNATAAAQESLHRSLLDAAPTLPSEVRHKLIKKWMKGPKHERDHDHD